MAWLLFGITLIILIELIRVNRRDSAFSYFSDQQMMWAWISAVVAAALSIGFGLYQILAALGGMFL